MYDAGLYDPFEEEDEVGISFLFFFIFKIFFSWFFFSSFTWLWKQGFSDFMQEMLSMMDNVRAEVKTDNSSFSFSFSYYFFYFLYIHKVLDFLSEDACRWRIYRGIDTNYPLFRDFLWRECPSTWVVGPIRWVGPEYSGKTHYFRDLRFLLWDPVR